MRGPYVVAGRARSVTQARLLEFRIDTPFGECLRLGPSPARLLALAACLHVPLDLSRSRILLLNQLSAGRLGDAPRDAPRSPYRASLRSPPLRASMWRNISVGFIGVSS